MTEPSEAEKREFRRTLREMPSEEISDRRNAEQFGKYDPNDPRNSHWKVIEANRLIDWRRRRQQLVPQWISALIALAALVIAVAELVEALKVP